MKKYNPQKIEKKWQAVWQKTSAFKAQNTSKNPKFYALVEFPYPSGDGLHVGHCRSYTALDILSRKRRMQGFNVLYPMGWDAFGLPTENYAIKMGLQPAVVTKKNTDNFRKQMKSLGLSFDWSREVNTTDPKYYQWTQWIFLHLFKQGLAEKQALKINWCPKDKIGLANEEVIDGKCERCGTAVEKKDKVQWVIKITKYADRLIDDLKNVDYPQRVKDQQINWIGRSEGALLKFQIINPKSQIISNNQNSKLQDEFVEVFTTRPDTIFGATFLVVAPEHSLLEDCKSQITNDKEVEDYIRQAKNKSDLERQEQKEKTGVELKGIKAINPATKKEIPVFVADYVLTGYGTGAIMAVPAHDERDFEFAKRYNLPINYVILPRFIDNKNPHIPGKEIVFRKGVRGIVKDPKNGKYLCLNWKKQPWTTFVVGGIENNETPEESAKREIYEETGYKNLKLIKSFESPTQAEFFAAHKNVNRVAHVWDVLFELINDERDEISAEEKEKHEIVWLDESKINEKTMAHAEINFILNRINNGEKVFGESGVLINSGKFDGMDSEKAKDAITEFVGGKKTVQYKLRDWVFSRQHYWGEPIPMINCKECGWVPVPEKDLPVTLPKVKKYEPTDTGESPLAAMEKWVKVKCPVCKNWAQRETDTMPNWAGSNWYFLRYTDPKNAKELAGKKALDYWMPVDWYNGGMEHTTLHLLYSRFVFKFLWDIGAVPREIGNEPYKKRTSHGIILAEGGVKMSKSKGNVINPDDIVRMYGADALRVYEMFMGPFEQMIPWDSKGIVGSKRFIERIYHLILESDFQKTQNKELAFLLNKTIKKVGEDIESMKFNTSISSLMILVNSFSENASALTKDDIKKFLIILSPFAPHLAEELWEAMGFRGLCAKQSWPEYDASLIKQDKVLVVVQVNGKFRDKIEVATGANQKEVEALVLASPKVKPWIDAKEFKKVIFVPDKLINIVV